MYEDIKDETWWDGPAYALADQPFAITDIGVDESAGIATATFTSTFVDPGEPMTFQMAKDGPDWQIVAITITGVPSGEIF